MHAQFPVDLGQVPVDCADAHEQGACHLPVRVPGRNEGRNPLLRRRQLQRRGGAPADTRKLDAGFLRPEASAQTIERGQRRHERVLYVGDFDLSGGHIEHSFRDRSEALSGLELDWRRVALTRQQVEANNLSVIPKWDGRGRAYFEAVETKALDQSILLPLIDRALADLLPQADLDRLDRVERQARLLAKAAVLEVLEQ
jgi:hypothetical protein